MSTTLRLVGEPAADKLLAENPFALLVGMLLDQQIPMEVAFAGPRKLAERLGDVDARQIAGMDPEEFVALASTPPSIHRFPASMGRRVHDLAVVVTQRYDGDAARLWTEGDPDGTEVLRRLQALPGFGEQKAKIFLALLGKQRGLAAPGWREAAGAYGADGAYLSIADVTDEESMAAVRTAKRATKAAAKAARSATADAGVTS